MSAEEQLAWQLALEVAGEKVDPDVLREMAKIDDAVKQNEIKQRVEHHPVPDSLMTNEEDEEWPDQEEDEAWPDEDSNEEEKIDDSQMNNEETKWEDITGTNEEYMNMMGGGNMMIKKKSSMALMKVYTMNQIMNDQMPKRVKRASEILYNDNEDTTISILRHFNWNQTKLEESWFENQDKLELEIGLRFDEGLNKKFPDITKTLVANNGGMCTICYCDFDGEVDQLVCGHQYCTTCFESYLKDKVHTNGATCVFTKCP